MTSSSISVFVSFRRLLVRCALAVLIILGTNALYQMLDGRVLPEPLLAGLQILGAGWAVDLPYQLRAARQRRAAIEAETAVIEAEIAVIEAEIAVIEAEIVEMTGSLA